MAQKGNIRSIRISDQMAELIDQQIGANFTEKWENLVTRCVWELPKAEQRLEEVKKQIQDERDKLQEMHSYYTKLKWAFDDMQRKMSSLTVSINQAINTLDY